VYHIGLDLTDDQVQSLKEAALKRRISVKSLVSHLVTEFLGGRSGESGAGSEPAAKAKQK